ncbi:DUF998 domain-containing protein [Rhodococcoides trifolii]|nr:DUF998 domain-containing protein [Rhodococcus trifolii]
MKHRRAALALWVATVAYWPLQVLVASSWSVPYSIRDNVISDLGAVTCEKACSPDHALMNATFVGVGAATALGAVILGRQAARSVTRWGYGLVAASGVATIVVGFIPLDTIPVAHALAAQIHFGLQVAGMIVLAIEYTGSLFWWTTVCAAVSVVGGIAFVSPGHWGLGAGYSERLALDTLNVWTIGAALLLARAPAVRR